MCGMAAGKDTGCCSLAEADWSDTWVDLFGLADALGLGGGGGGRFSEGLLLRGDIGVDIVPVLIEHDNSAVSKAGGTGNGTLPGVPSSGLPYNCSNFSFFRCSYWL